MLINMAKNKKVTLKSILIQCVIGAVIGLSLAGYKFYQDRKSEESKFNAIVATLPVTFEGTGDKLVKFIRDDDNRVFTFVVTANDYVDSDYSFVQKFKRFDYIKNRACQDDIYYRYFYKELINGASIIFDIQNDDGKSIHTVKLTSTTCSNFR